MTRSAASFPDSIGQRLSLYDFGGLRVRSAFELSGLTSIHEERHERVADADINISLATAPPPPGRPVYRWRGRYQLTLEACGDDWLIRDGGATAISIADSGRALQCHCPSTDLPLLTQIIVRRVLPRVSALHGRLPMHAATLGDGEGAIMLLGPSGAGKSTMTAALALHLGWHIFSDDTSVLGFSDDTSIPGDARRPRVFSTTAGVSVWPPSQRALALPPDDCRPLQHYDGKVWYSPAPAAPVPPQPLRAVIFLSGESDGGGIEHTRLAASNAAMRVLSHLVMFNPRDAAQVAPLMARCTRMIAEVPIYRLGYPRDYRALPDVVDAIQTLRADTLA